MSQSVLTDISYRVDLTDFITVQYFHVDWLVTMYLHAVFPEYYRLGGAKPGIRRPNSGLSSVWSSLYTD